MVLQKYCFPYLLFYSILRIGQHICTYYKTYNNNFVLYYLHMYIHLYVQLQKKHAQIRNANEINGQNINKYLPTTFHNTYLFILYISVKKNDKYCGKTDYH